MKVSGDEIFDYKLTWLEGAQKGWSFHYRPKHPPLSSEFDAALDFIGDFRMFPECPEFSFEECRYRHVIFRAGRTPFDSNAEVVYRTRPPNSA